MNPNETVLTVPETETGRVYPKAARVVALLFVILGYLYKTVVLASDTPLGSILAIWALTAVSAVLVFSVGGKPDVRTLFFFAVSLLMPLSRLLTLSETVGALTEIYAAVTYLAAVYYAFENAIGEKPGTFFFYDLVRAVFVMPFGALGAIFGALSSKKGKGAGKAVAAAIIGLLAAVVPTVIVIALLSYDASFSAIFESISIDDLLDFAGDLLFAALFAVVLFGDVYASREHAASVMTESGCAALSARVKRIPTAGVVAFVLPLLVVYGIFFASQWTWYTSSFTGVLPGDLTYADYARDGFFQLCTVSGINAVILVLTDCFAARPYGKRSPVTVTAFTLTVFSTLVLIATALSKMALYIGAYGLTLSRVYASFFMLFLACAFIVVLISQFARVRVGAVLFLVGTVLLGVLAFGRIDRTVAHYNVDAYLDGRLKTVDVGAFYDLSADAVPEVMRLLDEDTTGATESAVTRYANYWGKNGHLETGFFGWNIARDEAIAALKAHGFEIVTPEKDGKSISWDKPPVDGNEVIFTMDVTVMVEEPIVDIKMQLTDMEAGKTATLYTDTDGSIINAQTHRFTVTRRDIGEGSKGYPFEIAFWCITEDGTYIPALEQLFSLNGPKDHVSVIITNASPGEYKWAVES